MKPLPIFWEDGLEVCCHGGSADGVKLKGATDAAAAERECHRPNVAAHAQMLRKNQSLTTDIHIALGCTFMYTVSAEDCPREISALPQSSVGAPCPMLLAGEHSLRLAFYVEEDRLATTWTSAPIAPAAPDDSDDLCAVVAFDFVYAHMFGPPNDEAFSGHPLAGRGLSPYGVFEIDRSSWLQSLIRMNEVHPYHRPERFSEFKHFVLSFHDTTFECLAKSFKASLHRGSVWRLLRAAQNAV